MIYYGKTKKSTHGHRTTLPLCTPFALATQSAQSYRNPTADLPCTYPIPTSYPVLPPLHRLPVYSSHRRPQRPSPTVLPCTYPTPPAQPSYPILPTLLHAWLPYTRSRNYPPPTLYHPPNAVSLDGPSDQVRPAYPTPVLPAMWWPTLHHSLARSQDGPSQRPSPASLPYTQPAAGRSIPTPRGNRHPTRPSPDGLPYTRPRHPLRGPVSRGIHWGNLGEGRLTLSRS